MSQTEQMLHLMEIGMGVREAVFVATGILPADITEAARAEYEREVGELLVLTRPDLAA